MTAIVETPDVTLGVAKGQNRTVFRNPRGNKRYYAFYQEDGTLLGQPARVRCDWSVDGIGWTEFANTAVSFTGTYDVNIPSMDAFDVIMHDDGSKLEVWIVGIGFQSFNDWHMLKYIYGTISDSGNAIIWNTQQTIDGNLDYEGLDVPFCVALTRTDNGELVVAYTEQYKTMGKVYILTMLKGSDGDGAAPSWSGTTALIDPSGNTNNQNKGEVWFGLENYSSSYGDRVFFYGRQPESSLGTTYNVLTSRFDWDQGGAGFTGQALAFWGTPGVNTGAIITGLIDDFDIAHLVYRDQYLHHRDATSAGDDNLGTATTIVTGTTDALTITLDAGPPADVPTSDTEAGLWTPSSGSDLYAMIDEGLGALDGNIWSGNNSTSCQVGGFSGGIVPITIRARELFDECTISMSTYKDDVWVETIISGRQLSTAYVNYGLWTTKEDWNEIRISANVSGLGEVLVTTLYAGGPMLYAFYHDSADSVDWNYKTSAVATISWSDEKPVSYHQDIIALSSWSRQVENSLHIAGQYGTTIFYNEHPIYKALSTTLADLEFPDQNYYLGPHST